MQAPEYVYRTTARPHTHSYLWAAVLEEIDAIVAERVGGNADHLRVLDLGCGNGAFAGELVRRGHDVIGVDTSESGISQAREAHPGVLFEVASAYEDLAGRFGKFDVIVSLEVVEHLMWPRNFADTALAALKPGATAIISTPFHGYWKNLALAVSGRMDQHFTALWDGGHVKFWSENTMRRLLEERGFRDVRFRRVGRVAPLAKSMIAIARSAY